MLNSDFYPTPQHVINLMTAGDDLAGKTVLEPSAGKGDLVDSLLDLGAKVIACEKEPELAKIVMSKCKFLGNDFMELTADRVSHIHCIYMNPPFSKDVDHILHAWEIAPDGCEITALCNFQTLKNRFSRARVQLYTLIQAHGYSQNLGDVFKYAERQTDVEIGMIKIRKPKGNDDFFDYFESEDDEQEVEGNGIMQYNEVREVVQRYVNACKLYDSVADTAVQMNNLIGDLGANSITFLLSEKDKEGKVHDFKIELQKRAWEWVFRKMKMEKYMTENLKKELNKFSEMQSQVPFTMKNIYKMIEMVVATHGQRMSRVIEEVFDKLTLHHHENRYGVEGWKTNSRYMVNKKVILEWVTESTTYYNYPSIRWNGNGVKMDDLTKALCYLTGKDYSEFSTLANKFREDKVVWDEALQKNVFAKDHLGRTIRDVKEWGTWYEWGFFRVKVYKKGTLHAEFLDKKVWELFNKEAAKAKGFTLPDKFD